MDEAKRASLQHRLKRRELWVSLWLTRLFAALEHVCGETHDGPLRRFIGMAVHALSRCLMSIFLCRAALRVTASNKGGFCDPRKRDMFSMRAIFGSALRQAFKARTLKERVEKMRRALDNSERLIARLARRLRRGMTRRDCAYTRAAICADAIFLLLLHIASIQAANTS